MEIISHRGYWIRIGEKNRIEAFERSFELGFGTETDVRDYNGQLVISHDVADSSCMKLDSFLELYRKYNNSEMTIALNIKANGLHEKIFNELNAFEVKKYFVFDMSIPDTIGYLNNRISFFSRQSEYEKTPIFYENCAGIWLDSFNGIWFNNKIIMDHLNNGKKVAIVSAELHNRDYIPFWNWLKSNNLHLSGKILLCTDYPVEAYSYFYE